MHLWSIQTSNCESYNLSGQSSRKSSDTQQKGSIVPRIPQLYLDCIVYLYPSQEDADLGRPKGGTGFLLGVNGELKEDLRLYIVTNAHVALKCNFVRLHKQGTVVQAEIAANKWTRHPHGDDVAITPSRHTDLHNFPYVNEGALVTRSMIQEFGISPGMETFMMGRLTGRDGLQLTNPSVRFGHLSMMAEPIMRDSGLTQENFLVDLPSLPGYSGSPVFIFETTEHFRGDTSFRLHDIKLLGINWGFHRREEKVMAGPSDNAHQTGLWIEDNSGFACVVPVV
jgi:hypothetical protein